MTVHVNSPLWREQFRRVSSTSNRLQAHLLRLAFRSALQVWTRAARLPAAILSGANLKGVDLRTATLSGAKLDGVIQDARTRMP
jgi:uncharacterized protein YjbI with pentapeptide repeats